MILQSAKTYQYKYFVCSHYIIMRNVSNLCEKAFSPKHFCPSCGVTITGRMREAHIRR